MMRFTPAAVSLAVLFAVTSSVSIGQKPSPLDPRSQSWAARGAAAFGAGRFNDAIDAYEAALVLDPRNQGAYIGLAQIARQQELPGKAIRYYDDALRLEPGNVTVMEAQGQAMLDKGAVQSAKVTLDKIKAACGKKDCSAADKLASAIATKGVRAPRIVSTSDLKPVPQGQTPVKE